MTFLTLLRSTGGAPPSGTFAYIKVAGTWQQSDVYIKVSGAWQLATSFIKTSGAWS